MLRGIGPLEIGLVLVVILIVFGAGKLPGVGSALGKSIREFRKATRGDYDEGKETTDSKSEQMHPEKKPANN